MISYQISTEPQFQTAKALRYKGMSIPMEALVTPQVNLLDYRMETLRQIVNSGGVIYWQCEGMWKKIPNAVIANTLSAINDWEVLHARRPQTAMPPAVPIISWDQTVSSLHLSTALRAPPLPSHQPPTSPTTPSEHD